ncbi:Ulp1 family isopeptidase [Bradyrhizobium sp. B097]|uniref:Ulp1 family isopeptidase n=1 Tax=Bradyrhizobium sp. B097 TaxID=3140244 RepID=UPI003183FE19
MDATASLFDGFFLVVDINERRLDWSVYGSRQTGLGAEVTKNISSQESSVEPNYYDPFSTETWMQQYAAMQDQQRVMQQSGNMPVAAGDFEQQLERLQLNSPDTSSAESGSPDARPAAAQRNQRHHVGGSMRGPSQSSAWDDRFGGARHSVDMPHAYLSGTAVGTFQSDLGDRLFSSTRYTAPSQPQPVAPTGEKKSRGLWSRVKSGIGKAFEGNRRKMPFGGPEPDVVYSELRIDYFKRGRPSDADGSLIEEFKLALGRENSCRTTIQNHVAVLKLFSEFLQSKGVTLGDVLGDGDLMQAFREGFLKVASSNSRQRLGAALGALQRFRAGTLASAPGSQPMHPQDGRLIEQFAAALRAYEVDPDGTIGRGTGRVPDGTIRKNLAALKGFARWLRVENREPMSTRAFNESASLAAEIEEYIAGDGERRARLRSALSHLRRLGPQGLQTVGPGPRLMGRQLTNPYPDDALMIDGLAKDALRKLGPGATREQKHQISRISSSQRGFSDWLQRERRGSIASRLNGTPQQERSLKADHKDFAEVTGLRSGGMNDLRKYLMVVEVNRALGLPAGVRSPAGEDARRSHSIPEFSAPQDTPSAGAWDWLGDQLQEPASQRRAFDELSSAGSASSSAWDFLRGELEQPASPSARASSSDIYHGLGTLVDLPSTPHELREDAQYAPVFPGLPHDAQLGALDPTSSLHARNPLLRSRNRLDLDPTDWLRDEHIQADYELLGQELQNTNPDLAARTRFVDPLVAHYHLRLGTESVARPAFQHIVRNRNGDDTADFLFLPVNDASATDPNLRGGHWSLLLVDRRARQSPVAYHYDSSGTFHSALAAQLAERLGANLLPVSMAQQQNGYDCGVFVVDGTRALVRRIAQGQRQRATVILDLNDLVVDRQALLNRLRTHPQWR